MKDPLVSVIVPVYNGASFLKEALRSILSQNYTNVEVIVVDDGSNDGTRDLISGCADVRVRGFQLERNQGVSTARKIGLQKGRGDLITFFDGDDVMCQGAIRKRVDYLRRTPVAKAVYGYVQSQIDDCGRKIKVAQRRWISNGRQLSRILRVISFREFLILKDATLSLLPFLLPTLLFRREAFERSGLLSPTLRIHDDLEYAIRLWKFYDFHYAEIPVLKYRFHRGSYSADFSLLRGMKGLRPRKRIPVSKRIERILSKVKANGSG